jgi:uncharacterized GH25 family protein
MNSKTLLIILAVMVSAIAILGWKVLSASNSSTNSNNRDTIFLSTDPNPLRLGTATFMIDVKDKSGKPVDNATVSFDINMTAMNMGTQQGNASPQGNGRYAASGRMSMRGPWKVSTKVTMPDGSVENKDFTVNVP